jgi:hypothetical protein
MNVFIDDEVNTEVKDNYIVISATGYFKRMGWEKSFEEMANKGDDKLLIPDVFTDEKIIGRKW